MGAAIGVIFSRMNFSEKLKRCSQSINKSKAAEAVGLSPTTISNYIAKGSIPRADIAQKIATALGVSLAWMVDDSQDWPPPKIERPNAESLTDRELIAEVARRYRIEAVRIWEAIGQARSIDWVSWARKLADYPLFEPIPNEFFKALQVNQELRGIHMKLCAFDGATWVDQVGEFSHGRNIPPQELDRESLIKKVRDFSDSNEGFSLFDEVLTARFTHRAKIKPGDEQAAEEWAKSIRERADKLVEDRPKVR
jgi:transcriptional regulator with XRE-family HTH domain